MIISISITVVVIVIVVAMTTIYRRTFIIVFFCISIAMYTNKHISHVDTSLSHSQEIKQKKEDYERKMAEQSANQASLSHALSPSSHQSNIVVQHGYCNGAFGNFVLFVSLAGFVFIVRYMVVNMV